MLSDEERDIVLHAQIQNVPDGCDDQVVGILIVGTVDGIVELQQFLLLTEYHPEQAVLKFAVYAHNYHVHFSFHCTINRVGL